MRRLPQLSKGLVSYGRRCRQDKDTQVSVLCTGASGDSFIAETHTDTVKHTVLHYMHPVTRHSTNIRDTDRDTGNMYWNKHLGI